jgi:hypothetical protein
MPNVGRPRALDDTKRREICALISAGSGVERAASYVGCSTSTIHREAARNAGFDEQLRRAELAAELEPLQLLRKKANTHWRAAAWLLERFNPERFVKPQPMRVPRDEVVEILNRLAAMIIDSIPDVQMQGEVMLKFKTLLQEKFGDLGDENQDDQDNFDPPQGDPFSSQF